MMKIITIFGRITIKTAVRYFLNIKSLHFEEPQRSNGFLVAKDKMHLGIKNERVHFILLSIFIIFADEKEKMKI